MDCIILDIDGTLWDTTPIVAKAWGEALEGHAEVAWRPTPENLKQLFGRPMWEIAAAVFPELSEGEQMKLMDHCCEYEEAALKKTGGNVFAGVVETIKELAETYKICIVSNCQAGYIELTMDKLGLSDVITDFECPGYTGLSKGENCRLVMERNGFRSAVYVGDTQGDADAAAFAGIPFVYCSYGFGKPDRYDYKIDRFSELTKLLQTLTSHQKKK